MSQADLAVMQRHRPPQLQTEIFAYGRMPLAFSARCLRALSRSPEGRLPVQLHRSPGWPVDADTRRAGLSGSQRDSDTIRAGLQPHRSTPHHACARGRGCPHQPQAKHTPQIIALFDAVRQGAMSAELAMQSMQELMPDGACNGYWHARPGRISSQQNRCRHERRDPSAYVIPVPLARVLSLVCPHRHAGLRL